MTDLKVDMTRIQTIVGSAFTATGSLLALTDGGAMSDVKLQRTLEKTAADFEKAVLELRMLCERYSPGKGNYGKRSPVPYCDVSGSVDRLGYNWLHVQLNTLLPHCRYQTPSWLSDTIRRLLDSYESLGNELPFFRERALLIIDEHSDIGGRKVFDQDNKGWKAVCNALKGRVIPDDDQYTLGVCLVSTRSQENTCHITLLELQDASDFFAFHSGGYVNSSVYKQLSGIS